MKMMFTIIFTGSAPIGRNRQKLKLNQILVEYLPDIPRAPARFGSRQMGQKGMAEAASGRRCDRLCRTRSGCSGCLAPGTQPSTQPNGEARQLTAVSDMESCVQSCGAQSIGVVSLEGGVL